jgi:hypothetical protein
MTITGTAITTTLFSTTKQNGGGTQKKSDMRVMEEKGWCVCVEAA